MSGLDLIIFNLIKAFLESSSLCGYPIGIFLLLGLVSALIPQKKVKR